MLRQQISESALREHQEERPQVSANHAAVQLQLADRTALVSLCAIGRAEEEHCQDEQHHAERCHSGEHERDRSSAGHYAAVSRADDRGDADERSGDRTLAALLLRLRLIGHIGECCGNDQTAQESVQETNDQQQLNAVDEVVQQQREARQEQPCLQHDVRAEAVREHACQHIAECIRQRIHADDEAGDHRACAERSGIGAQDGKLREQIQEGEQDDGIDQPYERYRLHRKLPLILPALQHPFHGEVAERHERGQEREKRPAEAPLDADLRIQDGGNINHHDPSMDRTDDCDRIGLIRPILERHGDKQQHEERSPVHDAGPSHQINRMQI